MYKFCPLDLYAQYSMMVLVKELIIKPQQNQRKNTRGGFIAIILDTIDFHQKPNFKIYIVQPKNTY
jgi:hypothetical protein